MTTIQIRIDEELKSEADSLFKELGTDTTNAIRMFLTKAVSYGGFPFEIKKNNITDYLKVMSENEFLDSLAESRRQSLEGDTIEADELLNEIKEKYGI